MCASEGWVELLLLPLLVLVALAESHDTLLSVGSSEPLSLDKRSENENLHSGVGNGLLSYPPVNDSFINPLRSNNNNIPCFAFNGAVHRNNRVA